MTNPKAPVDMLMKTYEHMIYPKAQVENTHEQDIKTHEQSEDTNGQTHDNNMKMYENTESTHGQTRKQHMQTHANTNAQVGMHVKKKHMNTRHIRKKAHMGNKDMNNICKRTKHPKAQLENKHT